MECSVNCNSSCDDGFMYKTRSPRTKSFELDEDETDPATEGNEKNPCDIINKPSK